MRVHAIPFGRGRNAALAACAPRADTPVRPYQYRHLPPPLQWVASYPSIGATSSR